MPCEVLRALVNDLPDQGLIVIAGRGGAGKSHLARALTVAFRARRQENYEVVLHDDNYREISAKKVQATLGPLLRDCRLHILTVPMNSSGGMGGSSAIPATASAIATVSSTRHRVDPPVSAGESTLNITVVKNPFGGYEGSATMPLLEAAIVGAVLDPEV